MVAIACFLALRTQLRSGPQTKLLFAVLLAGLVATLSRGPWLGTTVTAIGFWATANASRMRIGVALGGVAVLGMILNQQLPFLSVFRNVDASTVQYRSELLSASMQVFGEQPWLGSDHYVDRLAAKGMLQGEGIVDIVNTYVGVALSSGAVGLALFVALLATVLLGLLRAKGQYEPEEAQVVAEGAGAAWAGAARTSRRAPRLSPRMAARALFASVLGIGVTIGTVSSVSVIPWVYWAWLGTAVGFMRMAVRTRSERTRPPSANSTDAANFSPVSRQPAKLS
jgi:O-antigen ligase